MPQRRVHAARLDPRAAIVAESADYVIVEKPAFMEAHPSKPNGRATLWDGMREILAFEIVNGGQVSIINRLDRETSGLTLIAKSHDAARTFHQLMERRAISKEYLAVVWGWPVEEEFSVEASLLPQRTVEPFRIYLKQLAHPDGAACRTRFKVERRLERASSNGHRFAVVRCFPETGRMHQIRVHLAFHGFPIVGDKIYGPDELCYLEFIETGWTPALAGRLLLPRHALHSAALRIEELGLSWRSELPGDLAGWLGDSGQGEFARGPQSPLSINSHDEGARQMP